MDLASLQAKAKKVREYHLARLRENYGYARLLGFDSGEAQILSHKSKHIIEELARQLEEEVNSNERQKEKELG